VGKIRLIATLSTLLLLGAAGTAEAAKIKNGNFEQGTFKGWKKQALDADNQPSGNRWEIYDQSSREIEGITLPRPRGNYSPVIHMGGEGHNVLYRTLKVPAKAKTLSLRAFWHNDAETWAFDGTFDPLVEGTQYFSIDLIKKSADPETTAARKVLRNIYAPEAGPVGPIITRPAAGRYAVDRGGPVSGDYVSGWRKFTARVKRWRGKRVTLRLAEADTQSYNFVGIDDVKFK